MRKGEDLGVFLYITYSVLLILSFPYPHWILTKQQQQKWVSNSLAFLKVSYLRTFFYLFMKALKWLVYSNKNTAYLRLVWISFIICHLVGQAINWFLLSKSSCVHDSFFLYNFRKFVIDYIFIDLCRVISPGESIFLITD